MNENRFIELQHQMRENQVEVSDFLKDLDSWESDIKKKDDRLQKEVPTDTKVGVLLHIVCKSRPLQTKMYVDYIYQNQQPIGTVDRLLGFNVVYLDTSFTMTG